MVVNRSVYFIAMGGNLPIGGQSPKNVVSAALTQIRVSGLVIRAVSRFFATPGFPPGTGPDFVNAVIEVESDLAPERVLSVLHDIEARFARARDARWGARTLDLDLIAGGQTVMPAPGVVRRWIDLPLEAQQNEAPDALILPHPRLQDRAFVLVPLCDIAPDWRHPLLGETARAMLAALPRSHIAGITPI
jgi:2-amino-4-hydroxy-6-hydroxymethyldihydropteridine diphosphokinase